MPATRPATQAALTVFATLTLVAAAPAFGLSARPPVALLQQNSDASALLLDAQSLDSTVLFVVTAGAEPDGDRCGHSWTLELEIRASAEAFLGVATHAGAAQANLKCATTDPVDFPTVTVANLAGDPGWRWQARECVDGTSCGPWVLFTPADAAAFRVSPWVELPSSLVMGEGGSMSIPATHSPGSTIRWDLNGDGNFNDHTGSDAPFSAASIDGPATRPVLARADDAGGREFIASATVTINNLPPTLPPITAPALQEGLLGLFSISATDPGQDPFSLTWGFGDGPSTSTGPTVTHTYADDGDYTIVVDAIDSDGDAAQRTLAVSVANTIPGITVCDIPETGVEGSPLTFAATVADVPSDPLILSWDFGDLSPPEAGATLSHVFGQEGLYSVTLQADDGDGGVVSCSGVVDVANLPPSAPAIAGPTSAVEGESLSFAATSADPAGDPVVLTWDWGDGSPLGTGATLLHTYVDEGSYVLSVTADDGDGGTTVAQRTVVVSNAASIISSVGGPLSLDEGAAGPYTASATDAGVTDLIKYSWSFGDGSPAVLGGSVSHTWAEPGAYVVSLLVTDGDGGSVGTSFEVVVANLPPVIEPLVLPALPGEGEWVLLDASVADPGGGPVDLSWDVGLAAPLLGDEAPYAWPDDGTFSVLLTAEDALGLSSTELGSVDVLNLAPTLTIPLSVTAGIEGSPILFEVVVDDPAGSADPMTYGWDWGDGSPAEAGHPASHTFDDEGTYVVAVTIDDGDGGTVVDGSSLSIANAAPSFQSPAPTVAVTNTTLSYQPVLADGAADVHTFSLSGAPPPGLSLDPANGALAWFVPISARLLPNPSFTLHVDDGDGGSAAQAITLQVVLDDADVDGMSDAWEVENGLNPFSALDASLDPDGDGLETRLEFDLGTLPLADDRPTVPALLSPGPGAPTPVSPDLVFEESVDPQGDVVAYEVQVSEDTTFFTPTIDEGGIAGPGTGTVSWPVPVPLSENQSYFWRVRATDGTSSSSWSEVRLFFVNMANDPPTEPVLLAPADGALVEEARPLFRWYTSSDPDLDAVHYAIRVIHADGTALPGFEEREVEGAGNEATYVFPADLPEDTPLRWEVRALDDEGGSSASVGWGLRVTYLNHRPVVPEFRYPVVTTQNVGTTPMVVVRRPDDPEGALVELRIEVDDRLTFDGPMAVGTTVEIAPLSAANCPPPEELPFELSDPAEHALLYCWDLYATGAQLQSNRLWYGRAQAVDNLGLLTGWTQTSFTVRGVEEGPAAPVLVEPADGAIFESDETVRLVAWLPSADPEGDDQAIEFQFGEEEEDLDFGPLAPCEYGSALPVEEVLEPAEFELGSLAVGTWRWSARGVDSTSRCSLPARLRTFRVVVPEEPTPAPEPSGCPAPGATAAIFIFPLILRVRRRR